MTFQTDKVEKYVQLTKRKRDLNQELRFVQEELDILEQELEEMFVNAGVPSITVGKSTVYLRTQVFVSPKRRDGESTDDAKARACRALRTAGLGWMVSEGFNANTLRAAIKELREQDGAVPPEIEDAFNIIERQRVGVRNK